MKTTPCKLTLADRLNILSILPETGKYEIAVVCRDLREKLAPTQKEIEEKEIRTTLTPNGTPRIEWNASKDKEVEIMFTRLELEVIKSGLEKLNKEEKLPTDSSWISLYERFVKGDAKRLSSETTKLSCLL